MCRWSSEDTADGAAGVLGAAAGAPRVIPGMPVNLSQEQIQETLVLQMRLQQVCACVSERDGQRDVGAVDMDRQTEGQARTQTRPSVSIVTGCVMC